MTKSTKLHLASLGFSLLMLALPIIVNAQGATSWCQYEINSLSRLFFLFGCIIQVAIIPILFSLALIVFIVGVIKYIVNADEATEREQGRKFMLYGIVALFVMVSVWGLVAVIQGTFGIGNDSVFIPQLQDVD